jgi:DNA-binding CsgD family transcriptional regulator
LETRGSQSRSLAASAVAMRDEIVASRLRSLGFGLRNDRIAPPFRAVARARSRLAQLALPVLDRACEDLLGCPVAVVLAGKDARIIDRRVDAGRLRSTLDRAQVSVGHDWNERYVGTNALGTALAWAAPILVRGPDHFAGVLAGVTFAAAPIVDPRTGQLLGVVGLACALEDTSVLMQPYACRIAREIEGHLVDNKSSERVLLEHFVRARRCARGAIVSVNQRAMFTNAAAARFVDAADHPLLWEWARRDIELRPHRPDELRLAGGTCVTAQCEPVLFGSQTVGATIRLVVGTPAVRPRQPRRPAKAARVGWGSLSAAQLGVAELVATGLTNQEAATRLYVSHHTIDFHLRQIFNKLGISSRVELARIVAEQRRD